MSELIINPYRFAAGGAPFAPSDIAGLQLWIDSSDASTFTFSSGVVVSQWNDKSGNGRHFTQGTVSKQPSRTGTQNGLTVVAFDGTDDQMTAGDVLDIRTGSLTFCVVCSVEAGSTSVTKSAIYSKDPTTGNGRWALYRDTLGAGSVIASFANGSARTSTKNSFSTTTWQTWTCIIDRAAGSIVLRQNGTNVNPPTTWTPESTDYDIAATVNIGQFSTAISDYYMLGSIGEIVHYNSALSGTDLTNLETYLKTKWGT